MVIDDHSTKHKLQACTVLRKRTNIESTDWQNVSGAGTCCLAITSLMNLHKLSRISHQSHH